MAPPKIQLQLPHFSRVGKKREDTIKSEYLGPSFMTKGNRLNFPSFSSLLLVVSSKHPLFKRGVLIGVIFGSLLLVKT